MRSRRLTSAAVSVASGLALACAPIDAVDPRELSPGGAATVDDTTRDAFMHEVGGLDAAQHDAFVVGASFTQHDWVTAPASTTGRDGLGPLYGATRCVACHVRGGRGRPPVGDEEMLSTIVRLSVPGTDEHGAPRPEPTYGDQVQPRAVLGVPPEASTRTTWVESEIAYADGTIATLRRPSIAWVSLGYGPMAPDVMTSMRVAPSLVGLGLLEAIPDEAIAGAEDPMDRDGDGISGRAHRVFDVVRGTTRIGRFGWKATAPDVHAQTVAALRGDIGITSSALPDEPCTAAQVACADAPGGEGVQASDAVVEAMVVFQRARAVPARRDASDAVVLRGRALFAEAGCDGCHVPSWTTGPSDVAALAWQEIWPYTDLLLHDLGEGLADGRPDHDASGREWRTPPLWGLGLSEVTTGAAFLLHDGRARDVAEAVLWHGGEAEAARRAFQSMSAADRDALTRFVTSL